MPDHGSGHRDQSVWIVVPAFNEATRIHEAIAPLSRDGSFNVVVVDDGSSDQTCGATSGLPVWTLRHPFNCGQGAALRTGIEFALSKGATHLVTFDADGQHDCAQVRQMLSPLVSGRADITLGTRFAGTPQQMPFSRRCLLKAAVIFTRLTTGLRLTDAHNGFRAMTREAALQIRIEQPRMAHASEILQQIAKHRLRYVEVPVTIRYTTETLAKGQSTWDAVRIGGQLVLERLTR